MHGIYSIQMDIEDAMTSSKSENDTLLRSVQLIYMVMFIWLAHFLEDRTSSSTSCPSIVPLFFAVVLKDFFYSALVYRHILLFFPCTFFRKQVSPLVSIDTRVSRNPLKCDLYLELFMNTINDGSESLNILVCCL